MYRPIAVLVMLIALSVAGGATWIALQPPIEPLIVPSAIDVQVVATSWGQRQITYRASGPAYAWYYATAHRLEAQGWTALDTWRAAGTGSVYTPIVPLRFNSCMSWFKTRLYCFQTSDLRTPRTYRCAAGSCYVCGSAPKKD
jgi:hypothetical protein